MVYYLYYFKSKYCAVESTLLFKRLVLRINPVNEKKCNELIESDSENIVYKQNVTNEFFFLMVSTKILTEFWL